MAVPYIIAPDSIPTLHNLTPGVEGVANQMYGPSLSYYANKTTELIQMDPHRYSYIAHDNTIYFLWSLDFDPHMLPKEQQEELRRILCFDPL